MRNSGPFVPRGARGRVQVAARGGAEARAAGSRPGQRHSACAGARGSALGAGEPPSPPHCSASPGQGGPSGRRRPGGSLPCADARGALSTNPGSPAGDVRAADAGLRAARSPQLVSSIVAERVSHLVSGSPPLSRSLAGRGLAPYSARGSPKTSHLGNLREPPSHAWVPASERRPSPSFGDAWGGLACRSAPPTPSAASLAFSRRASGSPWLSLSSLP